METASEEKEVEKNGIDFKSLMEELSDRKKVFVNALIFAILSFLIFILSSFAFILLNFLAFVLLLLSSITFFSLFIDGISRLLKSITQKIMAFMRKGDVK